MEGAVLSSSSTSGFQSPLTNVPSVLCARTLPKQRRCDVVVNAKHHTYPRVTTPKRTEISRADALCDLVPSSSTHDTRSCDDVGNVPIKKNGVIKLKGKLSREVASAWSCRVGGQEDPAPADRVQSLFNDIGLYPTKTQVFEMLVCARQCARRKPLTLTFGEFCVFAAELRRCCRQARQTPNKLDSPQWSTDKEAIAKHINGSEASTPPPCEVFLGGSCNPTTWRSDFAIPFLKKMGITYFNPQVEDWTTELVEKEHRAKAAARALLFVLDSETRAVAASVEAAHLAAEPRDLLLVLKPYSRHQKIGRETISDLEYVELSRARATLQEVVERRGLPAFTDIGAALKCARAVLRGARTHPRQPLGHTIIRLKRAFDAAGGRARRLTRACAIETLRNVTQAPSEIVERYVPPTVEYVEFETFCAAVAEIAADGGSPPILTPVSAQSPSARVGVAGRLKRAFRSLCDRLTPHAFETEPRNGHESTTEVSEATSRDASETARPMNGFHTYNARLRAYGKKLRLDIPKNGSRADRADPENAASGDSGDSVFTPGTERRLETLPAMLGAPQHDVYLAGSFPSNGPRPEEILRTEGVTFVAPRANDYTRMFSAGARRSAPEHPESPRTDKKPRNDKIDEQEVELRANSTSDSRNDRLSASDFYTVNEEHTPQPFKGTYDEDLVLGARVLVFSACAECPSFSSMVLAAHYMGLRPRNTVLLLQPLDPVLAKPYSEASVKDYNRGRHYLRDQALRSGVPIFEDTASAMAHVIERLKTT